MPTNSPNALSGDVTGPFTSTVVRFVGGVTAANVASGANAANAATNVNTASTIVQRDASGNFSADTITANLIGNATSATSAAIAAVATNFGGSLSGDVSGAQNATTVSSVAGLNAASVASGAAAANAATNVNIASAIVKRDPSGDFSAGVVTVSELVADMISSSSGTVTSFGNDIMIAHGQDLTVTGSIIGQILDLINTDTFLINGNVALAPGNTLFVDNIAGESGTAVENLSVIDFTVFGNFNNASDYRLKMDIADLDDQACLAIINQLIPHEFKYVPEVGKAVGDDGSRHIGFLAQELKEVDPHFVSVRHGHNKVGNLTVDNLQLVNQNRFIPLLVGALKAESAEVQKLHERIQALEKCIVAAKIS